MEILNLVTIYFSVIFSTASVVRAASEQSGTCADVLVGPVDQVLLLCWNHVPKFVPGVHQYSVVAIYGCRDVNRLSNDALSALQGHLLSFKIDCEFEPLEVEPRAFQNVQNLTHVEIIKAAVTSFNPGTWNSFNASRLQFVFDYNNIASFDALHLPGNCLSKNASTTFIDVTKLSVAYNLFTRLRRVDFCDVSHLEELNLRQNKIFHVEDDALYDLHNLHILDLSGNNISSLPVNIFSRNKLLYVDLSSNALHGDLKLAFGDPGSLVVFNISDNNVTNLRFVNRMDSLEELILSGNQLTSLPIDADSSLPALKRLNLERNAIKTINLTKFNKLRGLSLAQNGLKTLNGSALPSSLTYMELQQNQLSQIPDLSQLSHFQALNISFNNVSQIYVNDFASNVNLTVLDLRYNRVEFIEKGSFLNQSVLIYLWLNNNRLKNVAERFINCNQLMYLDLSFNLLTSFSYHDVRFTVKELNISHNKLSDVGDAIGPYVDTAIVSLDVSFNNLTAIHSSSFPSEVQYLFLEHNRISSVDQYSFVNFIYLKTLDLSYNLIETPCLSWFSQRRHTPGSDIVRLELDGNPLLCSCGTQWLTWFLDTSGEIAIDYVMTPINVNTDLKCRKEFLGRWDGQPVVTIAEAYTDRAFLCSTSDTCRCEAEERCSAIMSRRQIFCPPKCKCYADNFESDVVVDCSSLEFTSVPSDQISPNVTKLLLDGNPHLSIDNMTFSNFPSLQMLTLNATGLSNLPAGGAFKNLGNLEQLYLNDNNLTSIAEDEFIGLKSLETLDLGKNKIETISVNVFQPLTSLKTLNLESNNLSQIEVWPLDGAQYVYLGGNPWNCTDCDYFRRFRTWVQQYSSIIRDSSDLKCVEPDIKLSVIDPSYCRNDTVLLGQNVLHSPLVPVLSTVLSVAAVFALLSALVYKFRVEIQVLVYARYGVRIPLGGWFRRKNLNEVSQNKMYDIFICHSSLDEDFLMQNVLPGLETNRRLPYNVCLHQRNFAAGAFITEAILEAVEQSSVTLLLLTRNFLQSEWCRFEFKMAHMNMMKDSQCKVIVVLLEPDLPNEVQDTELQLFLKTNTYLCWGDKMFWKKLYFALPEPNPSTSEF